MQEVKSGPLRALIESFEHPVGKYLVGFLARDCPVHGNVIEVSLARYSSNGDFCPWCSLISGVISFLIDIGRIKYKIDRESMAKKISGKVMRRMLASIVKGVANNGMHKPFVPASPILVVWNFTNACNLSCLHCYQGAAEKDDGELGRKERFDIVDKLVRAGVVALAFSGGEPLVDPDFFSVASYAKKRGFFVSLATNGTLLNGKNVKRLKKIVDYVEISLDGATARTHDSFRGVPGAFSRTIRGIRTCVRYGIRTCIATTLNKTNIHEIPAIYGLAKKLGARYFTLFNFVPAGRGKENFKLDVSPEERERVLQKLAEWGEKDRGKINVFATSPQFGRIVKGLDNGFCSPTHFVFMRGVHDLVDFIGGCGFGRVYAALEPNGMVKPCVFTDRVIGDLRKEDLIRIWCKSKLVLLARDREKLKGACGVCEDKYICGGCRARALGYFGDPLAPDPGCIKNEPFWKRISWT